MMYGDIVIILIVIFVLAAIFVPPIYSKITGKKMKNSCGCNCGCDCCKNSKNDEPEDKKE